MSETGKKSWRVLPQVLEPWVTYETCRSGGPGGQNVNKLETKVRVSLNFQNCQVFSETQKKCLLHSRDVARFLDSQGNLVIASQMHRTQIANKTDALGKLCHLITQALIPKVKRKPTALPYSQKIKRLKQKKHNANKKAARKKGGIDEDMD